MAIFTLFCLLCRIPISISVDYVVSDYSSGYSNPTGLVADLSNNALFTCDYNNHVILKSTKTNPAASTPFVGSVGVSGSADGTGSYATFNYPLGICIDTASGNMYIGDTSNNLVRKVVSAGFVTTMAGRVTGNTNGIGSFALFNSPVGCSFLPGTVYVADSGNNQIRKLLPASGIVSTLAGGFYGTYGGFLDSLGTFALFSNPTGVAADSSSNVYVADSGNNVIRKISSSGIVSTVYGSSSSSGAANGFGTFALFNFPARLIFDWNGNILMTDQKNNLIRKIYVSSGLVTTLAGSITSNSGIGTYAARVNGVGTYATFSQPVGITLDNLGNIFIADSGNNVIRQILNAAPTSQPTRQPSSQPSCQPSAQPAM